MTDKEKIREEVVRMHNLLPIMDGDNISVNYADRICTTLEIYIDSLQEEPVSNDFEEEYDNYTKHILACDVQFKPFTHLYNCAKYFFELGLNTKGKKLWHKKKNNYC